MRSRPAFDGLETLLAARGTALLATATLLAGSRSGGEDLLQAALERALRRWDDVRSEPEIYLRRTIYHLAVDSWRMRRRRPEVLGVRADPAEPDGSDLVVLRGALLQALAGLPPRQRAVLVLRYFEELDEAETAAVLGCSVGTVKSSASRALARLRQATGLRDLETLRNGAAS
jgi:RNA polymerase sigma-70 factor (sigma-E family)